MYYKRGLILLVLLFLPLVAAQETEAPDWYQSYIEYGWSGTQIQDWTTICNTDPFNPGDDSPWACPQDVGNPWNPDYCAEDGPVDIQWRMWHETDEGAGYDYTYTGWQTVYTINRDVDQDHCDCFMSSTNYWQLGNEGGGGNNPDCCGDDGNEFRVTRDCNSGCTDSGSDVECCNNANDCVFSDVCTSSGSCDNLLYCNTGSWEDPDTIQARCNSCLGGGNWLLGGVTNWCCGDDSGEFSQNEQGPPILLDGVDSWECCDEATDCVDDDYCYNNSNSHDANDDSQLEFCANGQWATVDGDQTACENLVPPGVWDIGFSDPGTNAQCCGNDVANEFNISSWGAYDGVQTEECCNAADKCVFEGTCTPNDQCRNVSSAASTNGDEYCEAGVWRDSDNSSYTCTQCSTGIWQIDPFSDCCGDDTGETRINETDSVLNDSLDSDACCPGTAMCVDDDSCFANETSTDLGELEAIQLSDTGDMEYCNGTSGNWQESDDNEGNCYVGLNTTGDTMRCNGDSCWQYEGESAVFGAYETADSGRQIECCGDDNNEFYIQTNFREGCCDTVDDFMATDDTCQVAADLSRVYGYIEGEVVNGSYEPLEDVWVSVKWTNFTTINEDTTDALGYYEIFVQKSDALDVYVTKPGHEDGLERVNATNDVYLNFTLDLTNECLSDCSRLDDTEYRCDRECQNVNNCTYNDSIKSQFLGDDTMRNLCDGLQIGWRIKHNDTHDIQCCSVGYYNLSTPAKANVEFEEQIVDAYTYFAGTVLYEPSGKLYSVFVVIGDTND